jgi:STE24 endopeptidase
VDDPRRYDSIKRLVAVAGFVLDVLILAFLLFSGSSIRIREWLDTFSGSEWVRIAAYTVIITGLFKLVSLPLSFYSSYLLEHRFGLSRQTPISWMKDEVKSGLLGLALSLVGVEGIYALLRDQPKHWWIYASLAFIAFVVALTKLAPVLLMPLFFKFRPIENPDLQNRVARLERRTNTTICGIFEWSLSEKTRKANAAVVGWGNTRRIIVSDTLLENFTGEEIEVIMAHELCHHVKNHIWLLVAFQSVLTVAGFYVAGRVLPPLSRAFGIRGIADIANLPLLALIMMTVSFLSMPLKNYFSRKLETAADLYALDITRDALAFVSSMEKLADINLANKNPNKIIEFLFYSHPSVEERIKLAADRVNSGTFA